MEPKKNEVATINSDTPTPATLLQLAVESGADIDKLEKLMDMQERWESNQAKKAFNSAMVDAQSEMPAVKRSSKGQNSLFADLADITKLAKPIYTKCGFSISFYEGDAKTDSEIRICADVMHKDGHTKTYYLDLALDDKGPKGEPNKTKVQGKGSTTSYGRRYLVCMIFNIATGEDIDGGLPQKQITEEQAANINTLQKDKLTEKNFNDRLFKKYKVKEIRSLTEAQGNEIIKSLSLLPDIKKGE